ncbi:MAG: ABC transporter permease [Actinomycetales bacterium]|nr:ABC transporter permease [Actinomycetales bacterium]
MGEPLLRHAPVQFAYVVPDLANGIRHWVEVMGAGPFFVMRDFLGQGLTYRGAPSTTRVHYAFGQCGPVQVQLIAQDDPGPSIYRDMYPPGQGGFHHMCSLVPLPEWDEQVARFTDAGFEVAASLTTTVPVVYLDCREGLGCFVELYGRTERTESFFAMVRMAHEDWDGVTDPVRARDGSAIELGEA